MITLPSSRLLPALLLTALIAACSSTQQQASVGIGNRDDHAKIRRVIERRTLLCQRGDSVALTRLFTDDAVVMATDLVGSREIKRWEQTFAEENEIVSDCKIEEIRVNGDWAYARLRVSGTITKRPGGDPQRLSGRELALFERQNDGSWKITRLMANGNLSSPPDAPSPTH